MGNRIRKTTHYRAYLNGGLLRGEGKGSHNKEIHDSLQLSLAEESFFGVSLDQEGSNPLWYTTSFVIESVVESDVLLINDALRPGSREGFYSSLIELQAH